MKKGSALGSICDLRREIYTQYHTPCLGYFNDRVFLSSLMILFANDLCTICTTVNSKRM